jgi:glycosyltransferase involved in cell wall biosynthesis
VSKVSILILTYNEEANLPACLESVRWSDDIHVVDSGSTDRTLEIARAAGAHLYTHPFENFSRQRNWALANARFRHQWVLSLDADEVVPPELAEEIERAVAAAPADVNGYAVRWKVLFLGRWLQHVSQYNSFWFLRLYRHRATRYEDRQVNAYALVEGKTGRLENPLVHDNRKGLTALVEKFNRYAALEAEETLRLRGGRSETGLPARLGSVEAERRRRLKQLYMRLPFRATIKFFYLFVVCRGFLDGLPGFFYAALMAEQEFLIAANVATRKRGLPIC